MTNVNESISRLTNWLGAGDKAQDRYGYQGAGRMPIESDIRTLLEKLDIMETALEKAEAVLEGVIVIRYEGDALDVIRSALND